MITNQLDNIHNAVREYMPGLFPRLAINYFVPMAVGMLVAVLTAGFLARWLPSPTPSALGFVINLAILIYGWRYLENRNHATALLVLYTTYSRHRRELLQILQVGDEQQASTQLEFLEEAAGNFIDAAQEQHIKPASEKE